jgi:flagellar motility protein MotE (MotC chaperone)
VNKIVKIVALVVGAALVYGGALFLFVRLRGPLAPESAARARKVPVLGRLVPAGAPDVAPPEAGHKPGSEGPSAPPAAAPEKPREQPGEAARSGAAAPPVPMEEVAILLRELRAARKELKRREDALQTLEQGLTRQQAEDLDRRKDLERMLTEVAKEKETLLEERRRRGEEDQARAASDAGLQAQEQKNLKAVAQVYESMGAEAAAGSLKALEDDLAARILMLMNPRKSGKVMDQLPPEKAAALSRAMKSLEKK